MADRKDKTFSMVISSLLVGGLLLAGCGQSSQAGDGRLRVLATTTIVADVVAQVGGDSIDLTILMPPGSDPHTFSPRPQDLAALSDADLIFANGAGLEAFLPPLLEGTGSLHRVVEVSQGLELLGSTTGLPGESDPHTWMDPNNVILWTETVAAALSGADPQNAAIYQANATAYITSLRELDGWIRAEVENVPPENRLLVEDHAALGYFAQRYDFIQEGSITGSFSSEAAPTAQELAALEDTITQKGILAIFLTEEANRPVVAQVGRDTGVPVIWLQIASLSATGGLAPSYLDLMRYNVISLVNGLK